MCSVSDKVDETSLVERVGSLSKHSSDMDESIESVLLINSPYSFFFSLTNSCRFGSVSTIDGILDRWMRERGCEQKSDRHMCMYVCAYVLNYVS